MASKQQEDGRDDFAVKFGAVLRWARERVGKTQTQVQDDLQLGENTLSRWETGDMMPAAGNREKLMRYYGVRPEDLCRQMVTQGLSLGDFEALRIIYARISRWPEEEVNALMAEVISKDDKMDGRH